MLLELILRHLAVGRRRAHDGAGKMPAVGRVGIGLRLKTQAGMRAIDRAVMAGNRAIKLAAVVKLQARLARAHGEVGLEQLGRLEKIAPGEGSISFTTRPQQ